MGSLRFAGEAPPGLVLLVAAASAMFVAWMYLRESKQVASPYSYLLPALRASAVAMTILLLAGPVLHRRTVVGKLGRVVFAIDASQSMSVTDSGEVDSSPSRMRRAINVLLGNENDPGWLSTLKQSHELDVIAFSQGDPALLWSSRQDEPVPMAFPVDADGQRTDLASSLSAALDSFDSNATTDSLAERGEGEHRNAQGNPNAKQASNDRAALVIFSDGRDNVGRSAADLAKQLQAQSYVVHAVGVGSTDEPIDAGIVNVVAPGSVASDGKLAGELVVKRFGLMGKALQVRIESAGKTIWQTTVTSDRDAMQTVPFELDVKEIVQSINPQSQRGVQRSSIVMDLTAAVEAVEGDSVGENNSRSFRVAANTRDRKLLIVDGSSRWETRYLKNLFQRDPAWEVNTVIAGPGTEHPTIQRGETNGEFPDDREAMSKYDAIVLGEIGLALLSQTDLALIKEFVARGGGLIAIDGHYRRLRKLADGPLSELIPIRYDRATSRLNVQSFELTTMGKEHPLMNLYGRSDQVDDFWSQIPAPQSAALVYAQEGAEVWANSVGEFGLK